MACAEQVAAYKLKTGDAILKPDREQYLLETLGAQAPDGLRQEYVSMLKSVMRVSRKHQYETILSCEPARLELTLAPRCDQPARVVYQGLPASYQAQAAAAMFPDAKEVSHVPTFEDVFRAVSEGRADAGRVVYQGLPASYQAQAAAAMFPDAKEVSHVPTFEDVFRAVSEGRADAGVVPVENSTVGTIHEACDLLVQYDLHISHSHVDHIYNCLCACPGATLQSVRTAYSIKPALGQCQDLLVQYDLHISHSHVDHIYNCLCACPGATLQSVRTAYSIKPALGQCQNFLKEHGLEQQEAANTAVAAQMVAASGDLTLAAVCSEQAAALYGLTVLAHNINDDKQNQTRFIAVSRGLSARSDDLTLAAVCSEQAAALYGLTVLAHNINDDKQNQTRFIAVSRGLSARSDDNRISLVFTLPHKNGSLAAALSVCADHEINLTEIHSRPLPETPWNYRFYIDLEGSLCDPAVRAMIYQLSEELSTVRILGEIHSRPLPETPWNYRFYIDLEGSLCDPAVRAMIYQLSEELSTVRILGSYRISDSTETR